ncbi:MAG: hypothetical protein DHS20C18_36220 [Saprospiraceae bacterium]|nr:MAG: hypothetical protein DHS20C18_36220 [Saprospiraceae bacterium]
MEVYIEKTKKWIEQFVIGLNLCPFASVPFQQDKIRYVVNLSKNPDDLIRCFLEEMQFLDDKPSKEVETTLIIFPNQLNDFLAYLDFLTEAEEILEEVGLEGILQIASFHPEYQFANTAKEDAENYTNRSPYPMLHLLREASVEQALRHYPEPENIPIENILRLKELGVEGIKKLFS